MMINAGVALVVVLNGLMAAFGAEGCAVPNHGLLRFGSVVFDAAYPFATVRLVDKNFPLEVRLEAMNPLVPGAAETSGILAALMRWCVRNPGTWRGNISFTRQPKWHAINSVDGVARGSGTTDRLTSDIVRGGL